MNVRDHFFNLDQADQGIRRDLAPGLIARVFAGDHAMLSIVEVGPHAQGSVHSHAEEQWGVLLEGSGVRIQDGAEIPVTAGDFWRTPGHVVHGFCAGSEGARILDIFSPPRSAYKQEGSGFAAG